MNRHFTLTCDICGKEIEVYRVPENDMGVQAFEDFVERHSYHMGGT